MGSPDMVVRRVMRENKTEGGTLDMKVFEVNLSRPDQAKSREFASLDCKRTDNKLFDSVGRGKPVSNWRKIELFHYQPRNPKPDVYHMTWNFVFSERVCSAVGKHLEKTGQLLPVSIKGNSEPYYLYNCTHVLEDVVDEKRSIWEYYKEEADSDIYSPCFHSKRLRGEGLFKCAEYRGLLSLFVVEETGDHRDGEFKALMEHHGFTGMKFDLCWSDKDGPTMPKVILKDSDPIEFRMGDGKRLIQK